MTLLTDLVLAVAAGAGLAYTLGAHLVASAGAGTIHRGSPERRAVALTFDDGPDPVFTPRILDTLARGGARATFFVVGTRAQRHPEILRAVAGAQHEIGNHTHDHRHLWLLSPARTRAEMTRCADVVAEVTGRPPRYFRPPWGKFNLEAYRHAARLGEARVLWSLRPEGWRPAAGPEAIVRVVERRLRPGAVINLHDGGVPGAAARTAQALPALLDLLRAHGYRCVPLGELLPDARESGARHRSRARRFWDWYERRWADWFRVEPVSDDGAVALSVTRYRGPAVRLRDGTEIQDGELVGELHLSRDRLLRLHRDLPPREVVFALRRDIEGGLRALAALVAEHPRYRHLQAFHAVSLFWRETKVLGFEPRPMEQSWSRRLFGWYLRMLLARDHPLGRRRLQRGLRDVGIVWVSRSTILNRYGAGATERPQ